MVETTTTKQYKTLHVKVETIRTPGKARYSTRVIIDFGPYQVAEAILGGVYRQDQAVEELRRNPQRFTLFEGYQLARKLQLV